MFCLPQSQTEVARGFRSLEQRVNDQCFMNDRLIGGPYFQAPNVSLNLFLVVDEIKINKPTVQDSIVFAIPNAPGSCLVNLSTTVNPKSVQATNHRTPRVCSQLHVQRWCHSSQHLTVLKLQVSWLFVARHPNNDPTLPCRSLHLFQISLSSFKEKVSNF